MSEGHGNVTQALMYQEGSSALRNYSNLTMQVRTLAMQLFLGYIVAVALAVFKTDGLDGDVVAIVLINGSLCLYVFSVVLLLVNWHFASAFNAIRNSLADLEPGSGNRPGPWKSHENERGKWKDPLAYSAPFVALCLLASVGFVFGAHWQEFDWPLWVKIAIVPVSTLLVAVLGVCSTRSKRKDTE